MYSKGVYVVTIMTALFFFYSISGPKIKRFHFFVVLLSLSSKLTLGSFLVGKQKYLFTFFSPCFFKTSKALYFFIFFLCYAILKSCLFSLILSTFFFYFSWNGGREFWSDLVLWLTLSSFIESNFQHELWAHILCYNEILMTRTARRFQQTYFLVQ